MLWLVALVTMVRDLLGPAVTRNLPIDFSRELCEK